MSVRLPGDLRGLLRLARKQRWNVEKTRGSHYRITSPSGEIYVAACSPSDWRAVKNVASALRAMGLRPRGQK